MKFLGWPPQPQAHNPYQQPHTCSPPKESQPFPQQPEQVEVPPEFEVMELNIPEGILDLLDEPQEVMSDFDAWAQDVLNYQF